MVSRDFAAGLTPEDQPAVKTLPAGWTVEPLSEVCQEIVDGTHYTPTYVDTGVPFFSVETLTSDDFRNTKFISPRDHEDLARRCRLKRGDILLTRIGSLGVTKLIDWDVEASIYVSLALLRPNAKVSSRYLYAYTQGNGFVTDLEARSLLNASPKKINLGDIGGIPIPIPPPEEQDAIADAVLDAQAAIAALKRLIDKKRAAKQGASQLLLTGTARLQGFDGPWTERRLAELADITMGQSPSSAFYNTHALGLPLVQGNADIRNRRTIARVWTRKLTKRAEAGDIVLTVRAPVGAVGLVSELSCLGRGVCGLRPRECSAFVFHALAFAEPRWKALEQGSTFTAANSTQVSDFRLLVPDDEREQAAIAQVLSDVDAEIDALTMKRRKLLSIRHAMMQSLLTGRVRIGKASAPR